MTASFVSSEFRLHLGRGWLSSENSLVRVVNGNDANGYYSALGLKPDATREEIRRAFIKLIQDHHPDRGGNQDDYQFLIQIAEVLLNSETKIAYDSVGEGSIYLGDIERDELARSGLFSDKEDVVPRQSTRQRHWACLTDAGHLPGRDTDTWISFCREVSPAVGYHGKIRAGVVEGGPSWPCDPSLPWGTLSANSETFVVFKRGVPPNRLHALCAMLDWKKRLLLQTRNGLIPVQGRKEK